MKEGLLALSLANRAFYKANPVSSDYNHMKYYQTCLGTDYLVCSNQTLSIIDFDIKDHSGIIVSLHSYHVSFSDLFVNAADDETL